MVYIKLDQSRAVIYLGSHNWSAPALGGRPTTTHRNAEISLRIEVPFVDSDLEGKDHSLAAEVNRHMKHCWNYKTCRTVTVANKEVFKDWRSNNCDKQQKLEPLSENIAILAVNTSSAPDWNTLENVGLYFRSLVEPEEGEFLWTAQNDARLFVLVWSCIDDLKSRKFPILLIGSTTMKNASKRSSRIGTDTADVGEFKAALSDNQQKDEHAQGNPIPPATTVENNRQALIEYFDFSRVSDNRSAVKEDEGSEPFYRFYVKIERVVLPEEMRVRQSEEYSASAIDRINKDEDLFYKAEQLALSTRSNPPVVRKKGYRADGNSDDILDELKKTFSVDTDKPGLILPRTQDPSNLGMREGKHLLYDAFLPDELGSSSRKKGDLVPDPKWRSSGSGNKSRSKVKVKRIDKIFTNPMDRLIEMWRANNSAKHS